MSLTPAMIDALVAAGGTIEQLAAMVKADLAEQEARRAEKREGNAERQRRFKAKRRGNRSNALPSVTPPIEDHTPHVSSDEETRPIAKTRRRQGIPTKPEGVDDRVWTDFVAHRTKKGGVTETAVDGIRREAATAGWTLNAALSEVVSRNWQGFKADWVLPIAKPPDPGGSAYLDQLLAKQKPREHVP